MFHPMQSCLMCGDRMKFYLRTFKASRNQACAQDGVFQNRPQARKDGIRYVWVDACCIGKTSSTELSEARNSMFQYYQNSKVCYVYLSDVSGVGQMNAEESDFTRS